jgi:hypothetical protein
MKNCFMRRGGDSERRTDKPQKTVRRPTGVALRGLILKVVRRRRKTDLIDPKIDPKLAGAIAASQCALPERRVTLHSGDIGNTSGLCGSAKCLGRSVTKWMNGFDS